jgi:hemoglobin-like flavoprotein
LAPETWEEKMGGAISRTRIPGAHRFVNNIIVTDQQLQVLNESWILIEEAGSCQFGELAFKGLFQQAPETFPLFTSFALLDDWENSKSYKHHCTVVLKIIGSIIKVLLDPPLLNRNMDYMGMRHSLMPVKPEHFEILGGELIKSFQTVLGERFTSEMSEVWGIVYNILSTMLQAHIVSYNKEFQHLQSKFN